MKNMKVSACALAAACTALLLTSTPAVSSTVEASSDAQVIYEVADSPWMNSQGQLSANVEQLVQQIQNSLYHGLNPENYQLNKIAELSQQANTRTLSLNERQRVLAELESTLDRAFYKLAAHLGSSLVEGRDVQPNYFRSSPKIKPNFFYDSLATGERSIDDVFNHIAPNHYDYVQLQDVLRNLMHEKSTGLGRTQVPSVNSLSVGDEHEVVRAAKLRLLETGDYTGDSGVDFTFDESFKEAVIEFQNRHHISPTGELNEKTIAAMNRSVNDDITRVVVSLERWRWMPRELGFQRVIANVPDFRLRMYNGEQKIADMAVVVGKRKHKTPMFSETIKHVVAAPTWTVPASIANNELVPLERKNPGYLQRNNYELLAWSGGKPYVVPFSEVQPSAYHQDKFPYTIRQKAGDDNALGDVKILMPNKYAIYFHDTQAKKLFNRERRAFSHGCVRLHDPNRLASLIMQIDGVSQERTNHFLASKKTNKYDLDRHIDSHIIYVTTFVDSDGKLNFRDDVYSYDKKITSTLQRNSLLTILDSEKANNIMADVNSIGL